MQSPQHNTQNSRKKIGSSSSQQDFEDVDDVYAGLKGTELIISDRNDALGLPKDLPHDICQFKSQYFGQSK